MTYSNTEILSSSWKNDLKSHRLERKTNTVLNTDSMAVQCIYSRATKASKFREVAEHRVHIQKSIVFLQQAVKIEIKNSTIYNKTKIHEILQ